MGNHFKQFSHEHSLVRAIHTVVKGRARYKIEGLYRQKALEQYLESRLPQEKRISRVRANSWTGNVLVIFQPDIASNVIALLLQNLVLNYRKQMQKASVKATELGTVSETAKNLPRNQSNLNRLGIFSHTQKNSLWSKHNNKAESAILLQNSRQKYLNRLSNQIVLGTSIIGTLVLTTLLLHNSGLDTPILLIIQKLHTPLLDRIMLGITFLGEPRFLLLLSLGWGVSSLFYRRPREAKILGIVAVGALGLNCWLKLLLGRARPALWDRLIDVGLYSFPSSHAMVSMATYSFLAYCLAKQFPQRQRQIFVLSGILIGAIGFSRLYLGVHWPTDVTAGYAIGLLWSLTCILGVALRYEYCSRLI